MFESQVTVRGMSADPAVQAMYDRLRGGGGLGITQGLNRIQQGGMAPALGRHMQDAARISAAQGQTDYNMALSGMNYGLFNNARSADRNAQLRSMQMQQSQQDLGRNYVMQLLAPFLGQVMQAGGV